MPRRIVNSEKTPTAAAANDTPISCWRRFSLLASTDWLPFNEKKQVRHINQFRYRALPIGVVCAGDGISSPGVNGHQLQMCTQNNTLCNRSKEFKLIHLDQILARPWVT